MPFRTVPFEPIFLDLQTHPEFLKPQHYSFELTVPSSAIDERNHVNTLAYLHWCLDAAEQHWHRNAPPEMLDTYVFNHDGVINWGEFNIANLTLKKELPYARQVFRFFDKNHDWKISTKELQKVKVSQLQTYILSKGKRRK